MFFFAMAAPHVMILVGRASTLVLSDTTSGDPLSLFTSLGVGGIIAGMAYMWQRDTAKQRDQAMKLNQDLAEGIRELKSSIDRSTEAHQSAAGVMQEMTNGLRGMPSQETWFRIVSALEKRSER